MESSFNVADDRTDKWLFVCKINKTTQYWYGIDLTHIQYEWPWYTILHTLVAYDGSYPRARGRLSIIWLPTPICTKNTKKATHLI